MALSRNLRASWQLLTQATELAAFGGLGCIFESVNVAQYKNILLWLRANVCNRNVAVSASGKESF